MKYSLLFLGLASVFCLTGCVSVKYNGQEFEPTTAVKIYDNRNYIDESYVEIGKCVAYGRYDRFSVEDISEEIRLKAEAVGANVVLIFAHQVIPSKIVTQSVNNVWDDGLGRISENSGTSGTSGATWGRLDDDFASYGKIGGDSNLPKSTMSYMRVIRAEFLRKPSTQLEVAKIKSAKITNKTGPTPDAKVLTTVSLPAIKEDSATTTSSEKTESDETTE
ncbi:MAG: hypothetical protein PHS31_01080 [Victivallaceae bacterium]|nr:hypothetical protein [Victivallaceae bacterium]MDD4180091.1 hypothetical protein [Victivallaceae bacterium]